jgi:N6-adenosine-specific RNA methylase IME4
LVGLRGPPPPDCAEFDPYNPDHAEHVIREARKQGWFSVSPHGYNDVIVSQVRETSRKPDELYEVIESICPTGRKVELFGRMNNRRKGWLTIGNQLDGTELHEHELIHSYLEDGTEGGMNKSKK